MGKYKTIFGFEKIGYKGTEKILTTTEEGYLSYSVNKYEQWDPETEHPNYGNRDANTYYFPRIDTSKVTNMGDMLNYTYWRVLPRLETSNVTNMNCLLSWSYYVKIFPEWDTSNVEDSYGMFNNCKGLTTIPKLELGKANNLNLFCASGESYFMYDLANLGGFVDLGKGISSSQTLALPSDAITLESLTNLANTLYDMSEKGFSPILKLREEAYNRLTDELKTIFTAKGWTVKKYTY